MLLPGASKVARHGVKRTINSLERGEALVRVLFMGDRLPLVEGLRKQNLADLLPHRGKA